MTLRLFPFAQRKTPLILRVFAVNLAALLLVISLPTIQAIPSTQTAAAQSVAAHANLIFRGRHVHFLRPAAGLNANVTSGPPGSSTEPVPIPGGDTVPPIGFIHNFLPGPTSLGFDGIDVEPNGITNFRGFVAQTTLGGTATATDGITYNLGGDIRIIQGEYVSADGTHHRGTFVLI